jgi:hypothetical protein
MRPHHEESLRDDLIAARQVSMFREQFADALGAAGWPEGACVFLIMPASSSSLVTLQLEECATITNSEEADAVFFSPAGIAVVPHLTPSVGRRQTRRRTAPARRSSSARRTIGICCPAQTY